MELLPQIVGGMLTLAVMLFGLLIRRIYKAQDLLFAKYDAVKADVDKVKLVLVSVDPSRTAVFNAFMSNGKDA